MYCMVNVLDSGRRGRSGRRGKRRQRRRTARNAAETRSQVRTPQRVMRRWLNAEAQYDAGT